MKTFKLLIIGLALTFASELQAQVSVNVNVGMPYIWGPAGYIGVRYYYLPEVEAYYDIPSAMYIYQSGGVWVHRKYLPAQYRNYDLYHGHKVVLTTYYGSTPYAHYHKKDHEMYYARKHGEYEQKYNMAKPGREHSYKEPGYGNGKHEGHGNEAHSEHGNKYSGGNGHKK